MYYLKIGKFGYYANYSTSKVTQIRKTIIKTCQELDLCFNEKELPSLRVLQQRLKATIENENLKIKIDNINIEIVKCIKI